MLSTFSLLTLFALYSSAGAQILGPRPGRRSSVGRIIAGCIVGVICLLLFLGLLLLMLRRRRRARAFAASPQEAGQPQGSQTTGWYSSPFHTFGAPRQAQAPGMGHHQTFAAPPVDHVGDGSKYPPPPPYVSNGNQINNAQPNPPPPAHTKDEPGFVGGFRP